MKRVYYGFYAFLFILTIVIIARLTNLQIVNGEMYKEKSMSHLQTAINVQAPRGEIFDRYGRPLAVNRIGMSIKFKRQKGMKDEEINKILSDLIEMIEQTEPVSDSLPITTDTPYTFLFSEDQNRTKELQWKKQMELEDLSASDVVNYYKKEFNIGDEYSAQMARKIVGKRYDMIIRGFNINTAFTVAKDVPMQVVTIIKERKNDFPGVNIQSEAIREYANGHLTAHLLGVVGNIDYNEYQALKDKGYNENDTIGKQGIEKYLESQLRGVNGRNIVLEDDKGHYIKSEVSKEAVSGNNAYLTIDVDVQRAAEESLEQTINNIRANAARDPARKGIDVSGGSVVAIDPNTGEILACASNPTYEISRFYKDYQKLLENAQRPLFNRAIAGTYAPGSTFKMLVAVGALEEGVITPNDTIEDLVYYRIGAYTYKCMHNHGVVNVSEAIRDSCNYFFYTVGRKLTIENIDKYAALFGLGKRTGIELADEEASGTVSSKETKAKRGEQWFEGYTVQAAIGQDDNLFTPMQLAAYTAQIATGGIRYTPHFIKAIRSYDEKNLISETLSTVADEVTIQPQNLKAVQEGMRMVAQSGTAAEYFGNYGIAVAAKTGTAQVNGGSDNGVFVAYAPYDNPQIAVAVVIERSGSGAVCGAVAKAVIDAYLNSQSEPDGVRPINQLSR